MPTTGAPLGSPFGLGEATAAPTAPLGASTVSRYINPNTKSYEVDSETGHYAQMPTVRQRVYIALASVRGSSSVLPNLGLRLGGAIDARAENRLRGEVRLAVSDMVAEGVLRIENIDVFVNENALGRLELTLWYTDLTLGAPNQHQTVIF